MRRQPTATHKPELFRRAERPAITARDLYLHARRELAAYLAEHPVLEDDAAELGKAVG